MPFFSVITPSFNQGDYIEACIRSVLDQQDADFEHLVFDNESTDRTHQILSSHPHLRTTIARDRGQSHAVNNGFAAAQGEIICWLNSDDAYPVDLFARLRDLFSHPEVDVVFGDVSQVAYDGSSPQLAPGRFEHRLDLVHWWTDRVKLHQPAIFFRRSLLDSVGPLREDLHYAMDYEFWWRLSERHAFRYVPEILAIQHRQPDSKTMLHWQKVLDERERIFSPFYSLIDGGDSSAFHRRLRRELSDKYLALALQLAPSGWSCAYPNFHRALRQDPSLIFRPDWLGVPWRALRGSMGRSPKS